MVARWLVPLAFAAACSGGPFSTTESRTDPTPGPAGGAQGDPTPAGQSGATPAEEPDPDGGVGGAGGGTVGGGGSGGGAPVPNDSPSAAGATAGSAGAGGDSSSLEACRSAVGLEHQLGFFPELRDAQTQESHPFFKVTTKSQTLRLNRLALRYYYTREAELPESATCYWVTGDRCSRARLSFADVEAPTAEANRYLEVTFPGVEDSVPLDGLEVRVGFKTGSAVLVQSNDYSFDADATGPTSGGVFPYKPWPRVTLYVDGRLEWGAEPCAAGRAVHLAR